MENIFFNPQDLAHLGKNVIIGKTVRIRKPEKVKIYDNVIIDDFVYISGEVSIGSHSHIASNVTLAGSTRSIKIGKYSGVSAGAQIYASSSNYLSVGIDLPTFPESIQYGNHHERVILEDMSLIGANSIILPGVIIEEGVAISAGCIISKKEKIPSWSIYSRNGKTAPRSGKEKYLKKIKEFENEK
jgi:acetyltransferase-like isoleucine patch superfamily enzyme